MALATCVISGTITDVAGDPVEAAVVFAEVTTPFIAGTDYVPASRVSVVTDASGDFSLTTIRTAPFTRTITLGVQHTTAQGATQSITYSVTVPDAATADFETLITTP